MFSRVMRLLTSISPLTNQTQGEALVLVDNGAFKFLENLKEIGVVDPPMEEEIHNRLMLIDGNHVSLEEMKRITAVVIFERQFETQNELYGIYDEEWRLLFN